jgi:predicted Zn-dependent protease
MTRATDSLRRKACWTSVVLALLLLAGCRRAPRAPALRNDPVYQNTRAGIRFLVPDGWSQWANGELPPGPLAQERMLVEYRLAADQPTALRVTAIDLSPSEDLAAYLLGHLPGKGWQESVPPEACTAGGVAGTRLAYTGVEGGQPTTRDVTAFRRGERLYLFTGVYAATDTKARQEIRRAIESLSWQS